MAVPAMASAPPPLDPSATGDWWPAASMSTRVAELYDPATGTWSLAGNMNFNRNDSNTAIASVEIRID
jgi:hypothetical protein